MKYPTTNKITSKIDPSITYVLRRMNVHRRQKLDDSQLEVRERIRPLREELEPIEKEIRAAMKSAAARVKPERDKLIADGFTPAEAAQKFPIGETGIDEGRLKRWGELTSAIQRIDRSELTPAAVKYVTARIEGLEILDEADNPVPATVENLICYGAGGEDPDELYHELSDHVAIELGLKEEERKNSSSHSTSPGPEGGMPSSSSAEPAESVDTILAAAAASSTDPASASAHTTA